MASRNFRTTRRSSVPRRKRIWARAFLGDSTVDEAGQVFRPLAQFRLDGGVTQGATIAAVKMSVASRLLVAAGASEINAFRIGGKITAETSDTQEDTPYVRPYADWFIWCPYFHLNVVDDFRTTDIGIECDFKSMRKMEELNEDFALSVETNQPLASASVQIEISTLLLLP